MVDYTVVYEAKLNNASRFDRTPWCAYFYYVYKDGDEYKWRYYYYVSHHGAIRRNSLRTLTKYLAENARQDQGSQYPQPLAQRPTWRRKSHIIVLVENPDYKFANRRAIAIRRIDSQQNYTFFDAVDFDDIPAKVAGKTVTAVCCIDHMKRGADGYDLEEDDGEQHFEIILNPPLKPGFRPDEGGTNLGPPVPPPA